MDPKTHVDPGQAPSSDPRPYRPPLPPRDSGSHLSVQFGAQHGKSPYQLAYNDPRASSAESLIPPHSDDGRRTLLIVFIHGFLGDETSFQSFPAHLHNVLTPTLERTHVVHTKIYPKYKSRRALQHAVDDFSAWLKPHEDPKTDVVLASHSMGGLLAGEVVLKMLNTPAQHKLLHRILGTLNIDVPFLGLHPGVIKSGLGSIFNPFPPPPKPGEGNPQPGSHDSSLAPTPNTMSAQSSTMSPESSASQSIGGSVTSNDTTASHWSQVTNASMQDPNFNPSFANDIHLPVRKGLESALYFFTKHSHDPFKASKSYVTSHLEFGGAMADYKTLYSRYEALRALENAGGNVAADSNKPTPRVRFVNFYTASYGRPKKEKARSRQHSAQREIKPAEEGSSSLKGNSRSQSPRPGTVTDDGLSTAGTEPTMSSASIRNAESVEQAVASFSAMQNSETPEKGAGENETENAAGNQRQDASIEAMLPPIPPEPTEPEPFDPESYPDKDTRELMQKDHSRKLKAYSRALKDREEAIKDRNKFIEKREKAARKEAEKAIKAEKKAAEKPDKNAGNPSDGLTAPQPDTTQRDLPADNVGDQEAPRGRESRKEEKPKKDKKFCALPSKNQADGSRDPAWIRVFMENEDEVSAHTSVFFINKAHYEGLVRDAGKVITEWVEQDEAIRTVRELDGMQIR